MRLCRDLNALFAAIAAQAALYYPQKAADGQSHYLPYAENAAYSTALNTVRSPKGFFFPQTEDLMGFRMEGKSIQILPPEREDADFVLFGVRACDCAALNVLDRVFLAEPVDTYYANRRAHGILMTMACTRPAETCFCGTFGIDAAEPAGDIACFMDGDVLYLDAKTEKGEKLLEKLDAVTESCGDTAADGVKTLARERLAKLPLHDLTTEGFGGDQTQALFDSPAWAELSQSCLGCGTCTFVCPTCQCYDIRDFKTNDGVQRYRCWDSCMYSEFTKMSAGQPRLTQTARFRQRFMHKLVYYPANNEGIFSCVGCGRCVAKCPIHMNIVKVMKTLGKGGENHD